MGDFFDKYPFWGALIIIVIFCVGVPENPGATSCTDHGYIPLP